ncbi:MAG: general secretion pathway protein GspD [Methylibium sp.]|nr:general secretion pathway protein GspD [Methylibium sp.]
MFLSLVSDTRYSMLVHPAVSGQLSVTLKGVTLREALDAIREVYGFDYAIDGRRVTVFPPTLQTRVFSINALALQRSGRSEVRVSSGAAPVSNSNTAANSGTAAPGTPGTTTTVQPHESSQLSTKVANDFWGEVSTSLKALVGNGEGRTVITSPQTGTVAVRAMPEELRHVEAWLKATRVAVERQVMLEAKIVEVELREGYQSGIDWSRVGDRGAIGQTSVNPSIPSGVSSIINPLVSNTRGLPTLSSGTQNPAWPDLIPLPSAGGGSFGLALSRGGFQALLSFIESHGDTQILSSPRIATLNNQKAVLKVGTDDYFITGISGSNTTNSTTSGTGSNVNQIPTLTLTPFFSGIALDVTPQIDAADMITLHIHPSVSSVTEKVKQVDLGSVGNFRLPLASSSINETDTVVRIPDGQIVAIGGLMQMEASRRGSGLPGADSNPLTSTLFGNRANNGRKRELVVLIKPSIIRSAEDWERHNRLVSESLDDTESRTRRVIRLDAASPAAPTAEPRPK